MESGQYVCVTKMHFKIHFTQQQHFQVANELTHSGLIMPYSDINLGQHWLR